MDFWTVAVPVFTLLLGIGIGVKGDLYKDTIKRQRDRKEQEYRSLKKLKTIIDRIDRRNTALMISFFNDGMCTSDELRDTVDRNEKDCKEIDNEAISCSEGIQANISKYRGEIQKVIGATVLLARVSTLPILQKAELDLKLTLLKSAKNSILKTIDMELKARFK